LYNNVATSRLIDAMSVRLVVNVPGVSPKREIEPVMLAATRIISLQKPLPIP